MEIKDGKVVGELEPFEFLVSGVWIMAKRDYAEVWEERNPVLAKGELAFDFDKHAFKRGDGKTHWVDLPWFALVVE